MSSEWERNVAGRHTEFDTAADIPPVGSSAGPSSAGMAPVGSSVGYPSSLDEPGADELASDPFDDDLADRLKTKAPRTKTPRTTMALAGLVVLVAGFVGGALVQKNYGTTSSSTGNAGNGANGFAGFGGGAGLAGGQAGTGQQAGTGGRNATTGTVKFVDGTTLYVTTADGSVVTVKTSGTTTVRTQQSSALKDIPTGATVTVQGAAGTDGIVTATSVTAQK